MNERANEHDNAPGLTSGGYVNICEFEFLWGCDGDVTAVPHDRHTDTLKYFDDAMDFFNTRHAV